MDRWLGFIIPDVGFIFGGMCFMDQGMSFIFGGVDGWISLFLSLVVVVFVGRWWCGQWVDGGGFGCVDGGGWMRVLILVGLMVVGWVGLDLAWWWWWWWWWRQWAVWVIYWVV